MAAQVCSLPYYLSSDFNFLFDYNYKTRCLRLRETLTGQKINSLPKDALMSAQNINE